jgi:hypothetical protein
MFAVCAWMQIAVNNEKTFCAALLESPKSKAWLRD